jgi:restriction endonuclease
VPDRVHQHGLVASIAKSVAQRIEALPEGTVRYGRQNHWIGASGFKHQIDVSIRGQARVLLVECKHWKHRISVEAVLVLQGRLADIRPTLSLQVEGAIISTIGFQAGAQQVSQYFGIHCDLVRSAEEWGFKYAGNLVVQPRPASARTSTSLGAVIIGGANEGVGS